MPISNLRFSARVLLGWFVLSCCLVATAAASTGISIRPDIGFANFTEGSNNSAEHNVPEHVVELGTAIGVTRASVSDRAGVYVEVHSSQGGGILSYHRVAIAFSLETKLMAWLSAGASFNHGMWFMNLDGQVQSEDTWVNLAGRSRSRGFSSFGVHLFAPIVTSPASLERREDLRLTLSVRYRSDSMDMYEVLLEESQDQSVTFLDMEGPRLVWHIGVEMLLE